MEKTHWAFAATLALTMIGAGPAALTASAAQTPGTAAMAAMNTGEGYTQAVALIHAGEYATAIEQLDALNMPMPPRNPLAGNADVLSMLGFAHTKMGEHENAFGYYDQALAIDPNHLGANGDLGGLYLDTGDVDKATMQLEVLASACPAGCKEREGLAKAIEMYKDKHNL